MKLGLLFISILLVSCLENTNSSPSENPNSFPSINPDQIGKIKPELRLAEYSSFLKNESDTLPKNILTNDSVTKSLFGEKQINAWLIMNNFPKGVQASIVVNAMENRAGKSSGLPLTMSAKINTCCIDKWDGSTWIQLQVPFRNHPEDLPYKLVFEAKMQEVMILKDSITIF
jgi:hypothetical protein